VISRHAWDAKSYTGKLVSRFYVAFVTLGQRTLSARPTNSGRQARLFPLPYQAGRDRPDTALDLAHDSRSHTRGIDMERDPWIAHGYTDSFRASASELGSCRLIPPCPAGEPKHVIVASSRRDSRGWMHAV